MLNQELIERIRRFKEQNGYTLYELSKKLDIQIATLGRWLKTGRINKVYAEMVRRKLGIE